MMHRPTTPPRRRWLILAHAFALGLCAGGPALAAPPPAPSVPATDTYHGTVVEDAFRNLEDLKNPQTREWMIKQGEHAAALLGRIEGRDALRERITALARSTGDAIFEIERRPGGRLFYLKRAAGQSQFKLVVREGAAGAERVLVDPEALAKAKGGVPHAINWSAVSPDGRTLAYGISEGGSEDASLHLVDVASGRALRDPIPRVPSTDVRWSPDGRWLGFNQLRELPAGAPDTETYLDSVVYVLDRRAPRAAPRAVFGPTVNRGLGLDRLDVGQLVFGPGSRWMIARTTDTTVPEGKLFLAPLAALQRRSEVPWRAISQASDKITHVALRGNELFVRSYAQAPRGQVLRLALPQAGLAQARVVVPEPARGVLQDFALGRRAVYVVVMQGFGTRTFRHDGPDAGPGVDVAPALGGSTQPLLATGVPEADELWLLSTTWTAPARLYAQRAGTLHDTGVLRNRPPEGAPELQVTEVEVPSHDGVRVPLAVLHRKGLALDGTNPTLLDGYGAYGITTQAFYSARRFAWLERGGVLAYVNPRGSGAYGDAWHRAGFKATKPNTWKDGIAAARWLVEQRYASPSTLAVEGGSAGGIFVGRAVTTAPELFAAAILDVGVMDAVRAELSANGATNTSEFGSFKDPAEFKALLEMSTYHQVRSGVPYPALLFTHGLNDPRVDPWHSGKAVARFQQANPEGKPVLLRLDAQAGHGIGSTADQVDAKLADEWSFLLWQFGRVPLRP